MSLRIDRAFIRSRYVAALALIGIAAAAAIGLGYREASAYRALSHLSGEFDLVNRDLSAMMVAAARRVTSPRVAAAAEDRAILTAADRFETSLAQVVAKLSENLPAAASLFAPPRDAARDLDAAVALSRELAAPQEATDQTFDSRFTVLLSLYENAARPALNEVADALRAEQARHWRHTLAFGVVTMIALGVALFAVSATIFRPMERRIVEAQEALERETRRARRAEREKGAFLANMSHEIRTSLNGVLGVAEMLARSDLDAEQRRFVEILRGSGRSLLRIINDILDFSKIAAGETPILRERFEPERVFATAAQLFAPAAFEKGIELVLDLDPTTPETAEGDAVRLGQVTKNLLQNAIKFTETGWVELRTDWDVSAGRLRVAVRDTGPGVAAADLESIFAAFGQDARGADPRHGGTGLGLAISKMLVERMGGEIGVDSTPGQGSTFRFTLPLAAAPRTAPAPRPAEGLRVAVATGSAPLDAALARLLGAWGATIVDAGPADLALIAPAGRTEARRVAHIRPPGGGGESETLIAPVDPSALRDFIEGRAPDAPARATRARVGAGLRVLLVDDNEINLLVARHFLEAEGCEVITAASGSEAVRRARANRPDLILMDVVMPDMDGFAATAEIRRAEAADGRRTPIVALTAHALDEHCARCLEAGMDDHLVKPISPEAIAAALARWRPVRSPAPAPAPEPVG